MTPKEEYPYTNSNIVCECGHPIWSHSYIAEVGLSCEKCQCKLSDDAVEARYWARKMYSRLLTSLCRNQWALQRNIELEKQRDEALKHMHANFEEWYKALAERDEAREELKKLTSRWNEMVAEWHDKEDARRKTALSALYHIRDEAETGMVYSLATLAIKRLEEK